MKDPDTWWHLAIGERILAERTLPTADPYSFTVSGNDWMAYEWLGEVVMASAARWGGLPGLIALLIALSGMLLLLLYYYAYLRSGNVKAAFIACAVLLPAAAISFNLRPQLFGYAFLLITLIFLERFRQGRQKTSWNSPRIVSGVGERAWHLHVRPLGDRILLGRRIVELPLGRFSG